MSALASRFAEQAAQLHGLWLSRNRPPRALCKVMDGRPVLMGTLSALQDASRSRGDYVMNRHGWPVGVEPRDQAAGDGCGQLWRSLWRWRGNRCARRSGYPLATASGAGL